MVETITPVVHGRRSRYYLSIALHTLAATLTAAATGLVLGAVGSLAGAPWGRVTIATIVGVAVLYALRESLRLPIPLPNARRQVPEWWRTYFSPPVAATLYGAGLGIAFVTFLSYGTFVAVAVGALASGDPLFGAALCAPFGLARALAVAASSARPGEPAATVDSLAALGGTNLPRAVNASALALVAATGLWQLV